MSARKTTLRLQDPTPLPVERRSLAKIKDKIEASKISLRSPIGTAIRRVIIQSIAINLPKQKIAIVLANSISMTSNTETVAKTPVILKCVLCIRYPI